MTTLPYRKSWRDNPYPFVEQNRQRAKEHSEAQKFKKAKFAILSALAIDDYYSIQKRQN